MKRFLSISVFSIMMFALIISAHAMDYNATASLSLTEQYNDNITLLREHKLFDYITVISPLISLSAKGGAGDATISYSPTFNLYNDHSDNNSTSQQFNALGHYKPTDRFSFNVLDNFYESKESYILRNIEGAGPITNARERVTTNHLGGDVAYKLSDHFILTGLGGYDYTVTESGVGDASTYVGGLGLNYVYSSRTTFRVNGAYTLYDYKNSGNVTSGSYTAGVNYKLSPTIVADAFGGVVQTDLHETSHTNTAFTGGISITKNFSRGVASLAFLQSIIAGLESRVPIRQQSLSFKYSAPITAELEGSLSAFLSHYRSTSSAGIFGSNTDVHDLGGSADLSYRLLSWLSATLSYSYVHSIDKLTEANGYVNNIVMAGIKLSKQAKF